MSANMWLNRINRAANLAVNAYRACLGRVGSGQVIVLSIFVIGDQTMGKRGTLFVVALLCTAAAVTACRREMPHPNGLGAADVPAPTAAVKK